MSMAHKSTLNSGLRAMEEVIIKSPGEEKINLIQKLASYSGTSRGRTGRVWSDDILLLHDTGERAKPPPPAGRNGPPDHSLSRPYGGVLLHEIHEEYESVLGCEGKWPEKEWWVQHHFFSDHFLLQASTSASNREEVSEHSD